MDNDLNLRCDAINCQPVNIDWAAAAHKNSGTTWLAYEALECDQCGKYVVSRRLGHNLERLRTFITHAQVSGDTGCNGSLTYEGPMMNYWYPVQLDNPTSCAMAIAHLPLCVVQFENDLTGLALTGGGMDFSIEICQAFIALGLYPPLHFCDIGERAGWGTGDKDRELIAACMESCKIARDWAERKRESLLNLGWPRKVAAKLTKNARSASKMFTKPAKKKAKKKK